MKKHSWNAGAVVVVAALATFARGLAGGFVRSWEDAQVLERAREVSWDALAAAWSTTREPLALAAHWLDAPLDPSPLVAHAISLGLWCGALLVVLALMRRVGLGWAAATLATLFFGLHTVQVEAVTWVRGRGEIVAIALACGSVVAHLGSERATDARAWLARGLYLLALLAKTAVWPLPIVLFTADVLLRRHDVRRAAIASAPSLVLGALAAVASVAGADPGSPSLVLATYAHHLQHAVWPGALSPVYPLVRDQAPSLAGALAACGALAVAIALAWRQRASELGARVLFGLVTFAILLVPVSNVVALSPAWQERALSLPLLGLAIALGALLDAARASRVVLAGAAAVVVVLALRTAVYQGAWASDRALWEHAVRVQPRAVQGWLKLGEVRRDAGQYGPALRAYREAIELAPQARVGHGAYLYALLLRDEARLELSPSHAAELAQRFATQMDDAVALRELAGDLVALGHREAVTFVLSRALDVEPIPDERLERAALVQLTEGNEWLARFYLSRMSRAPVAPALQHYVQREQARAAGEEPAPATPP